jgi:hypothetical protein
MRARNSGVARRIQHAAARGEFAASAKAHAVTGKRCNWSDPNYLLLAIATESDPINSLRADAEPSAYRWIRTAVPRRRVAQL